MAVPVEHRVLVLRAVHLKHSDILVLEHRRVQRLIVDFNILRRRWRRIHGKCRSLRCGHDSVYSSCWDGRYANVPVSRLWVCAGRNCYLPAFAEVDRRNQRAGQREMYHISEHEAELCRH